MSNTTDDYPRYAYLHIMKLLFTTCLLALVSFSSSAQPVSYNEEVNNWYAKRMQDLKAENGWLNLAGLFWLQQGKNSFGSGVNNNVVFPANAIAKTAGYFDRNGDSVTMVINSDVAVEVNGKPVAGSYLFYKDLSPVAKSGSLCWAIIKRGDRMGIRLRNLNNPAISSFKGAERYPVNEAWKITATLQTQNVPPTIPISNVLGQTTELKTAGRLTFTINNKTYSLDALEEDNQLFVIFADTTNKKETYPSGRFLYAPKPGADGTTVLDFNKAINPPCAFTPYATCPLPPRQNRMLVAITAGEKRTH